MMGMTLLAIWLLHMAATVTPGANTLLVAQLAASGNRRQAMVAAAGVAVGSAAWALLAVFGVHAVFVAFPAMRLLLQVMGGLYLIWLASRLWRAGVALPNRTAVDLPAAQAFYRGLLTNFSNPKAALFFGSIFSASFPAHPPLLLLALTVAMVFANALCWYGFLALLFSRRAVRAAYTTHSTWLARSASAVLGALGAQFVYRSFKEM